MVLKRAYLNSFGRGPTGGSGADEGHPPHWQEVWSAPLGRADPRY
jgi:hypothetical protein